MNKGFLQSKEWIGFQESFGRKTFFVGSQEKELGIVQHELSLVGKYFYIPRGASFGFEISDAIKLAREEKSGWIRVDIDKQEDLEIFKTKTKLTIVKAPYDVQPREIFVVDITKSEEELLSGMKSKTRYNIRLAEKKGVEIEAILKGQSWKEGYLDEFIRLTSLMARRQGITPHPDNYYRKMTETIPGEILKLYLAKYEGQVVAADLVVFYGNTAIYLHGASDDKFRSVMAPHLLKWREILDAKKSGCTEFDFGGVKTSNCGCQGGDCCANDFNKLFGRQDDSWSGITKFKLGFSPETAPTKFLGSYDIILNPGKYWLYRFFQKIRKFSK